MKERNIYIGNCSKKGIYNYKLKKGKLLKKYETNDFERCTYLANSNSYLYSVIEIRGTEKEKHGHIVAYKKSKNKLINIDRKSSYGQGPCHIEISRKNKMIFVSNYIDGYFSIFKINEDGTIGKKIYCSVENKQNSHVHCAKMSLDNKFFFMVDLGEDLIIAYELKENEIKEVSRIKLKKDSQPRHIAIGKNKIYVVTEKSCEVYILKFENRTLSIIDVISILPYCVDKKESYTGCAIKISKNFRHIYVTIRGHNSITIYKTNRKQIKIIQNLSCEGNLPRDLEIDKSGKYVFVANQDSNEIAVFKRNRITGKLTYKNKEKVDSPTCVISE